MRNKSFLSGLLFLPLIALSACYGGGSCPAYDATPLPLKSGTFTGTVDSYRPGGQTMNLSKRVVIDRQAGTATFTFQRDGKQVVETWKLTTRATH